MAQTAPGGSMREFTDGSSAIVRGALDAGCTFFAGYPITPASPILMQMMRELPEEGRGRGAGRRRDRVDRDVHRRHAGRRPRHDRHQRAGPFALQREHRPGHHRRGAAGDRGCAAARSGDGRRHHGRAGRRAVRALGHRGRISDHRARTLVGFGVLFADPPRLRPGRAFPLPRIPAHRQGTEHDHHHGGSGQL